LENGPILVTERIGRENKERTEGRNKKGKE
jgi:hypothetical protein